MVRVTKRALLLSIGLGLGSLGFGLSAAAPANAADKVTWTWSLYGPPRAATVTMQKSSPSTATRELASVWLFEAVPGRPWLAGSDRFKTVTKLA